MDFKSKNVELSLNLPSFRSTSNGRAELSRPVTSRTLLKPNVSQSTSSSIFPCSGETALKLLSESLTEYETKEIVSYDQVFFVGKNPNKIRSISSRNNWGFDTSKHHYIALNGDHLAFRYEILEFIGKGTFGQVLRCFDHCSREQVAVKVVKNKAKIFKQSNIEVKILNSLNFHENIVKFLGSFTFRAHICMVFEMLSMNLYEYSKIHKFASVTFRDLQLFARQILNGLKWIHDKGVIHCDLKPENILFASAESSYLKIIDFGSSCRYNEKVYTYIQSRYYRAPEVILGLPYSFPIDLWSFGCILAELHLGYPLFPGENEAELLTKIVETVGLPPHQLIQQARRRKLFFEEDRGKNKEKYRMAGKRTLVELIGMNDLNFIDFLKDCLEWDPKTRITVAQALDHPWIQKNYCKNRKGLKESYLRPEALFKKLPKF
jgi:dual specificity tyrosine-phosphorylation-regulated kinase 2/3/4